eukprot:31440-Pelagococcus_subviridis.AAC.1
MLKPSRVSGEQHDQLLCILDMKVVGRTLYNVRSKSRMKHFCSASSEPSPGHSHRAFRFKTSSNIVYVKCSTAASVAVVSFGFPP